MLRKPIGSSWQAMLVTTLVYVLGMLVWKTNLEPRLPAGKGALQWTRGTFLDLDGAYSPLYQVGQVHADTLVVVGDSRVQSGISREILTEAGLGPVALITGPSAQARDLLRAVEDLPARRLILSISPRSVFHPGKGEFQEQLRRLRAPRTTASIDTELNTWLADQRRRVLDTLSPPSRTGWYPPLNPVRAVADYRKSLKRTPKGLWNKHLARVQSTLRDLQGAGWQIACIRIPTNPATMSVEDRYFPSDRFRTLCEALGVPYLEYGIQGDRYQSNDGSHLRKDEAQRFTAQLADELRGLDGWSE